MLNSTLHLNVFGRVNTDLIDKDSQCIYQLSRLSTLSHWSLPWSREWEAEARKWGEREQLWWKERKKNATAHHFPFCNHVECVVCNSLFTHLPLEVWVLKSRGGIYASSLSRQTTQKIFHITKKINKKQLINSTDGFISMKHTLHAISFLSFTSTAVRCHDMPRSLSPTKEIKKSAVGSLSFEWPEHVPGFAGQDPQDTEEKHCWE